MTPGELAALSAAELDQLIAAAAKERTKRTDPQPNEAPKEFEATLNPAWFVFLAGENTVIQIRHLAHGWVSIAMPPVERAHLASVLMHHSLLAPHLKTGEGPAGAAPVLPRAGGGTVH
ncbi:MAG TPA: hypothetical protein PK042_03200 [Usitatibacteraceae bacterium]|nr:hypothetical protein [Usitatibacteraceae bacterium]